MIVVEEKRNIVIGSVNSALYKLLFIPDATKSVL